MRVRGVVRFRHWQKFRRVEMSAHQWVQRVREISDVEAPCADRKWATRRARASCATQSVSAVAISGNAAPPLPQNFQARQYWPGFFAEDSGRWFAEVTDCALVIANCQSRLSCREHVFDRSCSSPANWRRIGRVYSFDFVDICSFCRDRIRTER